MTIKVPSDNIWDKILHLLGKNRKIIIPENAGEIYEKFGQYSTIKGRRENFWKALFRKSNNDGDIF
jgi:hypothetical protein